MTRYQEYKGMIPMMLIIVIMGLHEDDTCSAIYTMCFTRRIACVCGCVSVLVCISCQSCGRINGLATVGQVSCLLFSGFYWQRRPVRRRMSVTFVFILILRFLF